MNSNGIMNYEGVLDAYVTERSVGHEVISEFVQRSLARILRPFNGYNHRSVVVMDNLSVHKVSEIFDQIDRTGALVRFLPIYSPDLNPIEEMFSKVKQCLRQNQAAMMATANPRLLVLEAFNEITAEDCVGYIRHSGYAI